MKSELEISLLGEFRVTLGGRVVDLPASRKARALLAYLVATRRPHRRERLCELFWDMPSDPKAALRWALTKIRKIVDQPDNTRIVADKERVRFEDPAAAVDLHGISTRLKDATRLSLPELEQMQDALSHDFLEGMDGTGDSAFDSWLTAERDDVLSKHVAVLHRLVTHRDTTDITRRKWLTIWRGIDPEGAQRSTDDQGDAPNTQTSEDKILRDVSGPAQALRQQSIAFCKSKDGVNIAFASVGDGPPLLKAANWLSHLEFDWGAPIWGGSFAEIARHRTLIRYDERGCGLSDWNVEDLSFEAFVDDLEAVADRVGIDRFPLLGISQGAAVCIEYAVRHPERVTGLILVGGYAAGWRLVASPEEQERREAVMRLTELGWGTEDPTYRHIFSQTFMPEAGPDVMSWFDEFQRLTTSPHNAARFQESFGHINVRGRLAQVQVPTIVLHSKFDRRIPLAAGRELASGIPGARFVALESSNHVLVENEPAWQACFESVNAFLQEFSI